MVGACVVWSSNPSGEGAVISCCATASTTFGFSTTYWYDDVDFFELEARYGDDAMRRVYFHLLAFEANKAASLAPTTIDAGPYADLVTDAFWDVWETLFHNVWGVWRWENDLPDYRLPRPAGPAAADDVAAMAVDVGDPELLLLCGGGKDSLASMRLLERAGIGYDAFVYSHSTYGPGERQHRLVDSLLAHCHPRSVHRAWVLDDAVDAPIAAAYPELGIRRVVAAETVSSYWTALPVALQHGFTEVALGITRSTDEHNLVWDATGEAINYLWGMSAAAEELLAGYVQRQVGGEPDDVPPPAADLRRQRVLAPAARPRRRPEHALVRAAQAMVLSVRQVPLRVDELRRLAPARDGRRDHRRQPLRSP